MKKLWRTAVLASLITGVGFGIVGCEWESPSSDEYWSDSYNWVNFSGVYKNPNGGSVVTDFTSSASTNTAGSTAVAVGPVTVGFGDGGNSYGGQLLPNVVPGSLQISAGGVVFTDNGSGLLISSSGSGTMSGSISYSSGAWSIDLGGVLVPSAEVITASYSVFQTSGTTVVTSGTSSSRNRGTTGNKILSLTVIQEGNTIRIIDSDGVSYSGKMGSLRTATGGTSDGTALDAPRQGDIVIGQYSVSGVSRAGMQVEIVGVFQSTVASSGGLQFVMTARSIQGQWIEKGGKVGDVVGAATDSAINWTYTGTVNQNLN
ncbi:MAG: hypothetical protein R6X19_03760 [Kiritimatiellia bacterium]